MRILHLVSYSLFSGPLPPTVGLALAQQRLGHTVWLAHDTKRGAFNPYEEAATPRLVGLNLEFPERLTMSAKSSPIQAWRDIKTLRQSIASHQVDVVHVHLSHDHAVAALALGPKARPRSTRLVRTIHSRRSLQARIGQRWLNRRADGFITRCQEHCKRLQTRTHSPIAMIPGGIDATHYTSPSPALRAESRALLKLPQDATLVAHVALINDRGQHELLAALEQVADPSLHVLFVGRGEGEAALHEQTRRSSAAHRVHFAGYLEGANLLHAYAASDAAFLAIPGNDGSARAALEAMASELPVIAVQVDALADLVDDSVGYPIPTRTPDLIAQALRNFLSDPNAAATRGQTARRRVLEERTFAQEADATLKFYQATMP